MANCGSHEETDGVDGGNIQEKAKRAAAIAWLLNEVVSCGHTIINEKVAAATELLTELADEVAEGVHAMVREKIEGGLPKKTVAFLHKVRKEAASR